jgi:membrane-associated phospholipid phosphatase
MSSVFGTNRGIGIVSEIQQLVDGPVVLVFALLTQLGDVWFLFFLASVLYVAGGHTPYLTIDRRQGAFVLALGVVYTVLITVFKGIFAFPRPPGASVPPTIRWIPAILDGVVASVTTADGFGFPSGHALGSTLVWGGVALIGDSGTRDKRLVIAGGVVVLVSFSRLVLGVHYLIDVLAGIVIGAVALGVLYWVSDRGTAPGRVFLVAVVLGGTGLFGGITFESVSAFGGAVGGWLAWRSVANTERAVSNDKRTLLASLAVIIVSGGSFGIIYILEPSSALAFLGSAVTIGTVVGAPILGNQLARTRGMTGKDTIHSE